MILRQTTGKNPNCATQIRMCGYPNYKARAQRLDLYQPQEDNKKVTIFLLYILLYFGR